MYRKKSGALFHDADGNGNGGKVKFAKLDTKPALTHDDLLMI